MSNHLHIWLTALKKRAKEKIGVGPTDPDFRAEFKYDGSFMWTFRIDSSPPCYFEGPTPEDVLERAGKWIEDYEPPKPSDWAPHIQFNLRDIMDISRDFKTDGTIVTFHDQLFRSPRQRLFSRRQWIEIGGASIEREWTKRRRPARNTGGHYLDLY